MNLQENLQEIISQMGIKVSEIEESEVIEIDYFDDETGDLFEARIEIEGTYVENRIDHAVESSEFQVSSYDVLYCKIYNDFQQTKTVTKELQSLLNKSII